MPVERSIGGQAPSLALSPMQIRDKVLSLVDSIEGKDDLAPARIEAATDIRIDVDPDDSRRYGFHGQAAGDWNFGLRSLPDPAGGGVSSLLFYFNNPLDNNADTTPVCDPDFDAYKDGLVGIGFAPRPVYGEYRKLLYWEFLRGSVSVQAQVRGESEQRAGHLCISTLTINA